MKLRDVLEKAIAIINDDIDLNTPSVKLTKLIKCANTVYAELVEEYSYLKREEEAEFVDGRALFGQFAKTVKDITGVYKNGIKYPFTVYPDCVKSEKLNGKAVVRYVYHAPEAGIDDALELPPQFSAHVLANGVAAEYFYRSGLIDESAFYKNRYDISVINLTRKNKPIELKVERFL